MAASKLKRVSEDTETAITELAERENRTFVAQLDRVVQAGLEAMGERPKPTATRKSTRKQPTTTS